MQACPQMQKTRKVFQSGEKDKFFEPVKITGERKKNSSFHEKEVGGLREHTNWRRKGGDTKEKAHKDDVAPSPCR